MITYVNNSNAQKYNVLFEKATQALIANEIEKAKADPSVLGTLAVLDKAGKPTTNEQGLYVSKDPIDNIEKYFFYLPQLIVLGDAESTEAYKVLHSEGRRYTMLPIPSRQADTNLVSEAVLEVDANTRAITLPASFNSNGVAVQGDELAEVLYFRIDRYFDAMDLDTADIFIQWTNASGESGVSLPWVVDIESEPNKIYIGWALSSAITEKSGNVKFALRFYKWADTNKTKLSYSWSTKDASLKINSTLDFKFTDKSVYDSLTGDMLDAANNMISRIKNSQTQLTHKDTVEAPVYVINLDAAADGKFVVFNEDEKVLYADLDYDSQREKEVYTLKVEARSTDGGTISYEWKFTDKDGVAQISALGSDDDKATGSQSEVSVQFIETTDTDLSKSKLYYEKDGTVYRSVDPTSLGTDRNGDAETPKSKGWYEKVAVCVVNRVGQFQAVATNSKVNINSKSLPSFVCVVPMPSKPVIATQIADHVVLTEKAPVTMAIGVTNEEANKTRPGTLTYEWFKQDTEDETQWNSLGEAAEGKNELKITYDADKVEGDAAKEVEGEYKVVVYNTKNGQTVQETSANCHLSYHATAPKIAFPVEEAQTKINFNNTDALKKGAVHIALDPDWKSQWNISDGIEYRWYRSADEIVKNGDGVYDDIQLTSDEEAKAENANIFVPEEAGKYYCIVTNKKNGTEASAVSMLFYVTP